MIKPYIDQSNQIAETGLLLLSFDHRLHLFLQDNPHSLIKNRLQSLLSQGTALHIFTLKLFLDDFSGTFPQDGLIFGIPFNSLVFLSQIDFVSNKDLWDVSYVFSEFGIPLL